MRSAREVDRGGFARHRKGTGFYSKCSKEELEAKKGSDGF